MNKLNTDNNNETLKLVAMKLYTLTGYTSFSIPGEMPVCANTLAIYAFSRPSACITIEKRTCSRCFFVLRLTLLSPLVGFDDRV